MAATDDRRLGVIDIGTNTLLLLVADMSERAHGHGVELSPVHERREFGRLGQGLDASGRLDAEAISRSLDILGDYRRLMDELGVSEVRAVGTQALREAENAREFVEPAVELLRAPIEVIAGEREAELVYRAVAESLPSLSGREFVIADVGGGSTEVIVCNRGERSVVSFTSVPIGSVRLHERHLGSDPPMPEQVSALVRDIDDALAPLELPAGVTLVGSAGTATTIATMVERMREYDPARVQGLTVSQGVVERLLATLLEHTVAERKRLPGLPAQRADVIAAGVAIFARLLHRVQATAFVVNDRGVRWGVAYEMASG